MKQEKIYRGAASPEGQDISFVVDATETGLAIFIFIDEPSKHTEEEQADAIVRLDVEEDTDVIRVRVRLWDDTTRKVHTPTHSLALLEQEPDDK